MYVCIVGSVVGIRPALWRMDSLLKLMIHIQLLISASCSLHGSIVASLFGLTAYETNHNAMIGLSAANTKNTVANNPNTTVMIAHAQIVVDMTENRSAPRSASASVEHNPTIIATDIASEIEITINPTHKGNAETTLAIFRAYSK